MKYDVDSAMAEIRTRRERLQKKKAQQKARIYGATSVFLLLLLCMQQSMFTSKEVTNAAGIGEKGYGAFLVGSEVGGYVLVAVLAFVLGVVITAIVKYYRNNKK